MQHSEIDEDVALTLALAISAEDYKQTSRQNTVKDPLAEDLKFALSLQEEENRRQHNTEPESSSGPLSTDVNRSHPKSSFLGAVSGAVGGIIKAGNDGWKHLQRISKDHNKHLHPGLHPWNNRELCVVCHQPLPKIGNRITWSHHPFWREKACGVHYQDGTAQCASCERLKAIDVHWIRLDDGREICNDCSKTIVMNDTAAQSLYDNVLQFYTHLSLPLPSRPPLMLVDRHALNERAPPEAHHHGPESNTRGMTFTEESWRISQPRFRGTGLLGPVLGQPSVTHRHRRVAAIMVLFGLPLYLTGSILAHEVMHAYLKLTSDTKLTPFIEEGLCQLMAYLWIEKQTPQDPFEVRLCSFIALQIREHTSPIYGDGFRAAFECFQSIGLADLINHVKLTGQLPQT
eukprot:g2816.t1